MSLSPLLRAARRVLPRAVRRRVSWLAFVPAALRLSADVATFLRLVGLAARVSGPAGAPAVRVRLRPLGGRSLLVRPGTADIWALEHTFLKAYHVPPPQLLPRDVRVVWDLGCHIGTTMAHLAGLFPRARIIGVELDAANAELCRTNVAPWADRCEVVHAAVWVPTDDVLTYRADTRFTLGARVSDDGREGAPVQTVALDELLARSGGEVDFVKMDIEGAERRVLREATDWVRSVACLGVEAHAGYGRDQCAADLRALGFEVHFSLTHPHGLFAVRPA